MHSIARTAFVTFLGILLTPATLLAAVPSDVIDLSATAGDGSVTLNWTAAEDEDGLILEYKIYYGASSVQSADQAYESETYTDSDQVSFTISELENGTTYYFSMTAIDDEGNESSNYSSEVAATPQAPDTEAPSIAGHEVLDPQSVQVNFSEAVTNADPQVTFSAPARDQEFGIRELTITGDRAIIIVVDQPLLATTDYQVTFTTPWTDSAGNSAENLVYNFTSPAEGLSSGEDLEAAPSAETAPAEEVAEEPAAEEGLLSNDELGELDSLLGNGLFDLFSNDDLAEETETTEEEVMEPTAPAESMPMTQMDLLPQDVSNIAVDTAQLKSHSLVSLSWNNATDIEEDLVDQILYTKVGNQEWDQGVSLGTDVSSVDMEVEMNQQYHVRVVTVDRAGQYSSGEEFSFSTVLSATGPSWLLAGIALAVILTGLGLSRRWRF